MHHLLLVASLLIRAAPIVQNSVHLYRSGEAYTNIVGNCENVPGKCKVDDLPNLNSTNGTIAKGTIQEALDYASDVASESTFSSKDSAEVEDNLARLPSLFQPIQSISSILRQFLAPRNSNQFSSKATTRGLDLHVPFVSHVSRRTRVQTVYPGTVWCGMGNYAPNNATYGIFFITDQCCKRHDQCPDSIPAKGARHGLKNPGMFSRSHCDCDRDFYLCLKNANTIISKKIGIAYFNILRPQCYRREYPIIKCLSWFDKKCFTYLVDERNPKKWQWFDNRHF